MTKKYNFYYDESEHSRKINENTINASNYYDNFVTVSVGWNKSDEKMIEKRYGIFENKYQIRSSKGELKSTTLKPKDFNYGFSSLNAENVQFIHDFLNIFDKTIFFYFSTTSKIEYVIHQLFDSYHSDIFVDVELMKYSVIKSILVYHPKDIINGMYNNTSELIQLLILFHHKHIELYHQKW